MNTDVIFNMMFDKFLIFHMNTILVSKWSWINVEQYFAQKSNLLLPMWLIFKYNGIKFDLIAKKVDFLYIKMLWIIIEKKLYKL